MKGKEVIGIVFVLIVSMSGMLFLASCDNNVSAPSDYTISVPGDTSFTLKDASNSRVYYKDYIVSASDANGKQKEGIRIKLLFHGSWYDSFYTDRTFTTQLQDGYEDVTDKGGKILVNYRSAAFTCNSTDQTYTFGFRAQSNTVESTHTDTVTVSKCGS